MHVFALADRWGRTVADLEKELTPQELLEWIAFFKIKEEHKTG